MTGRLLKSISLAATAAAVAATAVCGCTSGTSGVTTKFRREVKTEPITVKATRVKYTGDIASSVLVGSVEPSKSDVVSARYPGRIKSINVRKGQKVSAGEVLAEIDAQSVNSAYDAALAVWEQAKDALSRVEKVYDGGGIPEAKMMEVRTEVAKAEASFRAAEKARDDCSIRAPYTGVVGEILANEGVEISALAPVVRMLDISSLEVHASIPENEYAACSTGTAVSIEIPATGKTLKGTLAVKGIDASKISRSYDCTFKFTGNRNLSGIMPGMICKVHLTGERGEAIVIPASAVMVDESGRYVWCCNGGTVTKKHITAGGFSGKGIIVTEGLEEGDLAVVEGSRKISEGMSGIQVVEVDGQ